MPDTNKTPTLLSASSNYDSWKKSVTIWSTFTSLPAAKQGAAVLLTLEGSARDAVLELSEDQISGDNGLPNVIKRLDELYLKDKTLQKYKAFDAFDNYRWPSHTPIPEFLHEFNMLSDKLQSYGTTLSDDLLAYKLLKATNLSPDHEKLAKATCKLKYKSMKDQLHKIFADMTTTSSPGATGLQANEIHITESPASYDTMYGWSWAGPRRCSLPPPRGANFTPHSPPQASQTKISFARKGHNPPGPQGNPICCIVCDSINNWANDCLDRRPPSRRSSHTYMVSAPPSAGPSDNPTNEIIMFQSDFDHPTNLRTLVSELWNHAVLDSGASKTVCGSMWLSTYVDSLSDSDKLAVAYSDSNNSFCFGDG